MYKEVLFRSWKRRGFGASSFAQRQSDEPINSRKVQPRHFLTPTEQRAARCGSQRPLVLTTKPPSDITGSKVLASLHSHSPRLRSLHATFFLIPQEAFSHARRAINTSWSNTCRIAREREKNIKLQLALPAARMPAHILC